MVKIDYSGQSCSFYLHILQPLWVYLSWFPCSWLLSALWTIKETSPKLTNSQTQTDGQTSPIWTIHVWWLRMSDQKTRTLQNTFITITLLMLVVSDYFHILPCFMLNSFLGCKVPLANPAILGPGARNCNFLSSGLFSKSIELSWRNTQELIRLSPDQIEIWKCWLLMKGENQTTWRKPLGAEKRAYNELNPNMVSTLGLNPKTHRWEGSDSTTAPSLLSLNQHRTCMT